MGILDNRAGSVMVEFSLTMSLVFLMSFSVVEFGYAWWQWNSAEKATQLATRGAVVSDPVASGLANFDCVSGTMTMGQSCKHPNAINFGTIVCSGASLTCSGGYEFSTTAFDGIFARMVAVLPNVTAANLMVEYRDLGLGFAGRGAPVPAVTVSLVNMTFSFVALDFLIPGPITMPDFRATLIGEDILTAGS